MHVNPSHVVCRRLYPACCVLHVARLPVTLIGSALTAARFCRPSLGTAAAGSWMQPAAISSGSRSTTTSAGLSCMQTRLGPPFPVACCCNPVLVGKPRCMQTALHATPTRLQQPSHHLASAALRVVSESRPRGLARQTTLRSRRQRSKRTRRRVSPHQTPSHLAPSHLAPSHLAPSHLAPSHLAPSHLAPSHFRR